jgi:probable F420-dependent oxidoreductase
VALVVRDARPEDFEAVARLLQELGRPTVLGVGNEAAHRARYRSWLEDRDRRAFVAEEDGQVVGLVDLELVPRLNFASVQAYVPDLIVSDQHRSRGTGAALLARAEQVAREAGAFALTLDSAHWRTRAHAFYVREGMSDAAKRFIKVLEDDIAWPPQPPAEKTTGGSGGSALKVGVQLPEVEREVRWPELRAMAQAAEESGFDSIWVGDHLLFRDPGVGSRGPWEAWSVLPALAAVTERVELGPLVASTSFHNPAMLAKKAATVDEVSGGRLILGLGAGWNEVEYRAFGFPFDHRVDRFEEAFTIIRTLLREGRVDFSGRWYQAPDCELLPRPSRRIPILVGTTSDRMLRIAARYADAWNSWFTWFGNRPEGFEPLRERVDAACRDVGRDPATLERTVALSVQVVARDVPRRGGPEETAEPIRLEDLPERLGRFASAGIGHVQLVVDPITVESIERIGRFLGAMRR